ncbi:conserved hypothetical protein [Anaeromyxobacter sp. K]|uniref:zf-HC2 domain-containing protein n=1 Tax=Anaeromyxobacter sp. (strain K) TaxID=447217 RepID=UPI00017BE2F5|nr:zf-HC2 domain-containing protein [Anaeromyxobacter sp. K]ACG74199.1 conserved hypothetical protein [Anaeromyxobacter sp. K]
MSPGPRCPSWDDLADWWAGDLAPADRDAIEEHLLGCAACAARAERLADLAGGVAALARAGAVPGPTTAAVLDRLERDGLRVHRYPIAAGQVVPCAVWPDDEVMAAVLDVRALAGAEGARFDVLARAGDDPPIRVEDVPLDRTSGTLVWLSVAALERRRSATRVSFRLIRVSAEGEAVVGEYGLAHEPWTGPSSPR